LVWRFGFWYGVLGFGMGLTVLSLGGGGHEILRQLLVLDEAVRKVNAAVVPRSY
jgi:hypothetical protein